MRNGANFICLSVLEHRSRSTLWSTQWKQSSTYIGRCNSWIFGSKKIVSLHKREKLGGMHQWITLTSLIRQYRQQRHMSAIGAMERRWRYYCQKAISTSNNCRIHHSESQNSDWTRHTRLAQNPNKIVGPSEMTQLLLCCASRAGHKPNVGQWVLLNYFRHVSQLRSDTCNHDDLLNLILCRTPGTGTLPNRPI